MFKNGIINLYKPKGPSSNKALSDVKKAYRLLINRICDEHKDNTILLQYKKLKFGYVGTLDPLAQGILPIMVGEATKLADYILHQTKEYEFSISWLFSTDTLDGEGAILKKGTIAPALEDIQNFCHNMTGTIQQVPPVYSAIKINGKRACDIMRYKDNSIEDIKLKPRTVEIYKLKILEHKPEEMITCFALKCSKGTYVRSIVRDMVDCLQACGHASSIIRTKTGNFDMKNSISLAQLPAVLPELQKATSYNNATACDYPQKAFIDLGCADGVRSCCDMDTIKLTSLNIEKLYLGQKVYYDHQQHNPSHSSIANKQNRSIDNQMDKNSTETPKLLIDENNSVKGIVILENNLITAKRMMNM